MYIYTHNCEYRHSKLNIALQKQGYVGRGPKEQNTQMMSVSSRQVSNSTLGESERYVVSDIIALALKAIATLTKLCSVTFASGYALSDRHRWCFSIASYAL